MTILPFNEQVQFRQVLRTFSEASDGTGKLDSADIPPLLMLAHAMLPPSKMERFVEWLCLQNGVTHRMWKEIRATWDALQKS